MKSAIDKIGFEIEGEYSSSFITQIRTGSGIIKGDGSISRCGRASSDRFPNVKYHEKFTNCNSEAEYNSPVFEADDMDGIEKVFATFQKAYETGNYHWNRSAGFHVHISFLPKVPPEIKHKAFAQIHEVHVYCIWAWRGDIAASDEMEPKWFRQIELPFEEMWPDDRYWMPLMLQGKKFQGRFKFNAQFGIIDHEVGPA